MVFNVAEKAQFFGAKVKIMERKDMPDMLDMQDMLDMVPLEDCCVRFFFGENIQAKWGARHQREITPFMGS